MTSIVRQEAHAKTGDQGGYEDFFQSLIDSVTPQQSRSRHEGNSTGFTDDGHQQSLTPHSPASVLMCDLDDGYQETPEDAFVFVQFCVKYLCVRVVNVYHESLSPPAMIYTSQAAPPPRFLRFRIEPQ